jgi:hypothetical protein
MAVIPCERNAALLAKTQAYIRALHRDAHLIGDHGLSEAEFAKSGIFRAAVESIRGTFSATMTEKRDFANAILDHLKSKDLIADWQSSGSANRHDYTVRMPNGKVVGIELKGCLDGNNSTIFERPPSAQEFVIWSICTNPGSDPMNRPWFAGGNLG